jgi:hypothetical protein
MSMAFLAIVALAVSEYARYRARLVFTPIVGRPLHRRSGGGSIYEPQ